MLTLLTTRRDKYGSSGLRLKLYSRIRFVLAKEAETLARFGISLTYHQIPRRAISILLSVQFEQWAMPILLYSIIPVSTAIEVAALNAGSSG
jgi:hypothetical protein